MLKGHAPLGAASVQLVALVSLVLAVAVVLQVAQRSHATLCSRPLWSAAATGAGAGAETAAAAKAAVTGCAGYRCLRLFCGMQRNPGSSTIAARRNQAGPCHKLVALAQIVYRYCCSLSQVAVVIKIGGNSKLGPSERCSSPQVSCMRLCRAQASKTLDEMVTRH